MLQRVEQRRLESLRRGCDHPRPPSPKRLKLRRLSCLERQQLAAELRRLSRRWLKLSAAERTEMMRRRSLRGHTASRANEAELLSQLAAALPELRAATPATILSDPPPAALQA